MSQCSSDLAYLMGSSRFLIANLKNSNGHCGERQSQASPRPSSQKRLKLSSVRYVVFDLETTGLSPVSDAILEIGALKIEDGVITGSVFERFVNPGFPIPYYITRINGIRDQMVADAPTIGRVLPEFLEWIDGAPLVAHNAAFDMGFIHANSRRLKLTPPADATCTVQLSKRLFPSERRHNLDAVCERLQLTVGTRHRALADVELTAQAFLRFQAMLERTQHA